MQVKLSDFIIILLFGIFSFLPPLPYWSSLQWGEVNASTENVRSPPDSPIPKEGLRLTQNNNVRISIGSHKRKSTARVSGVEVTVRPDVITSSERFVIMVYAVDGSNHSQLDGEAEYLGSYAWFSPVAPGESIKFFVNIPKNFHMDSIDPAATFELEIRLEPTAPEKSLKQSVLTVLGAELVW
ncbi:hypothetical protein [Desulforhopalus sp. IMCC35007]|uniref:hypothetical protein n=1 Tax=Desulforhopalus sp. IMCC35007 TaxID=2569543 RepID=UPI0010ADC14D|nr:hypothetical protein [Desulforhopalus sp. IMCC35007]TKB05954.1 hypothetical protein FCL48_22840 [Desulforhopalus sp. IMCC35007]